MRNDSFPWRLPALAMALTLSGSLSCGRLGTEVPDAWQIIDLWHRPATVTGIGATESPTYRTAIVTLRGRRVLAVQHRNYDQLRWRFDLGADPVLTFRPNAVGGACDFQVLIREPHKPMVSLYRQRHLPRGRAKVEENGDTLSEQVEVDLSKFAGRSVELVLRTTKATQGTCRRAQWASPTITSRKKIRRPTGGKKPNVILIAADTLRVDALGAWGRTPSVTPNLDRLAAESDVWLNTFSSSNSTNPSFASLMTGLYVKSHGVFNLKTPLPERHNTLAELLKRSGYSTSAVVSVRHLAVTSGLRQGFDRFRGAPGQFFAETSVNLAMQQIQELEEPFFLWLHLFDPHTPQTPPAPFHLGYRPPDDGGLRITGDWQSFRTPGPRPFDPDRSEPKLLGHADLYPGEVSYLDWQVGRLLDFLNSRQLLDDSLLVFVADHGENLGDHGIYFNHVGLFDSTIRVPLMIRWPGQQEGRQHRLLAQHFDIYPTILNFLGIDPPPNDGMDLRQAAERGRGRQAVFANHANDHGEMVRTESHKLYRNRTPYRALGVEPPAPLLHDQGDYFFDLTTDPQEQKNLADDDDPRVKTLTDALERWLDTHPGETPPQVELNDSERARLEALGYVE